MKIHSYRDAGEIPDDDFSSFIDAQIKCWGAEPFGEFVICTNDECKKVYSIEQVLGDLSLIDNHNYQSLDFCCVSCDSETEYVYEKKEFGSLMRQYFGMEVSAVLLHNEASGDNKVEGFGLIAKTKIKDIVEMEFNTRPGSFNKELLAQTIAQECYGDKNLIDKELICFHQLYIAQEFRNSKLFWEALETLFSLNDYSGIPIVLETRFDSNAYLISRTIGFSDVLADTYGYVIQLLGNYTDMQKYIQKEKFEKSSISKMKEYKKYAKNTMQQHPEFLEKSYLTKTN